MALWPWWRDNQGYSLHLSVVTMLCLIDVCKNKSFISIFISSAWIHYVISLLKDRGSHTIYQKTYIVVENQNHFINTFKTKPLSRVFLCPPVAPGGGRQLAAAEPRPLSAQPGASDPGGWGDEGRQDSVMHTAAGSSAAAAQSSQECCLSLSHCTALKWQCQNSFVHIVAVTLMHVFLSFDQDWFYF